MMAVPLSLYCCLPGRSYSMTKRWLGNRSSAGSLCMVGSSGPFGMMGKQLVVRCMTGTCAHAHAGGSSKACRSLDKLVWGKGYSACPCASRVRWEV